MGLDQNVYRRTEKGEDEEVLYWRKFNALQGWFEDNYNQENCGDTDLTEDVIEALLKTIEDKELEPTVGFFYGSQEPATDEEYAELKEQFENILKQVKEGYKFYYTCWY